MGCASSKQRVAEVAEPDAKALRAKRGARASIVSAGYKVETAKEGASVAEAQKPVASSGAVTVAPPPGAAGVPTVRYAYLSQRGYYPDAPNKTNQDAVHAEERLGGAAGAGGLGCRVVRAARAPARQRPNFERPLSAVWRRPRPAACPSCCMEGAAARLSACPGRRRLAPATKRAAGSLNCAPRSLLPHRPADTHLWGVFDGHGEYGTECAQFVADKVRPAEAGRLEAAAGGPGGRRPAQPPANRLHQLRLPRRPAVSRVGHPTAACPGLPASPPPPPRSCPAAWRRRPAWRATLRRRWARRTWPSTRRCTRRRWTTA